jgi:hypothetical protein
MSSDRVQQDPKAPKQSILRQLGGFEGCLSDRPTDVGSVDHWKDRENPGDKVHMADFERHSRAGNDCRHPYQLARSRHPGIHVNPHGNTDRRIGQRRRDD